VREAANEQPILIRFSNVTFLKTKFFSSLFLPRTTTPTVEIGLSKTISFFCPNTRRGPTIYELLESITPEVAPIFCAGKLMMEEHWPTKIRGVVFSGCVKEGDILELSEPKVRNLI
jgi:hypothetical protein